MSTPKKRSYTSCWTCKERRRRCDGERPACRNCRDRETPCGGYDLRLRWVHGIASRGRFTAATGPVADLIPHRVPGRQRDLAKDQPSTTAPPQADAAADPYMIPNTRMLFEDVLLCAPSSLARLMENESQLDTGSAHPRVSHQPSLESGPEREDALMVVDAPVARESAKSEHEILFEEFLSTGIHALHSTTADDEDQMLPTQLPTLCTKSRALVATCLALQSSMSEAYESRFPKYLDAALRTFRNELSNCGSYLEDATFTAGLLLCSVGLTHGVMWSMHLQGLNSILSTHGFTAGAGQLSPYRAHLIEVMGIMDLPTFAVGRQTPQLGIWRRRCRGDVFQKHSNRDSIEHVSGLPRSLIDIFSCVGEETEEEDFWYWEGAAGSFLQCQLWEAYRLAGMLVVRNRRLTPLQSPATSSRHSTSTNSSDHNDRSRRRTLPTTSILVARILSHVDAIFRASKDPESGNDLVVNAIHYPVFIAGLESDVLRKNEVWRKLIVDCFTSSHLSASGSAQNKLLLQTLEEFWQYSDERTSVDALVRAHGRELGLL